MRRVLAILIAMASVGVMVPATASASDWVATRAETEMWVVNRWDNVTDVRCYGREFDYRHAGRRYYAWFSCAVGFENRRGDHWYEVARVTPKSRHGYRYRLIKTFGP